MPLALAFLLRPYAKLSELAGYCPQTFQAGAPYLSATVKGICQIEKLIGLLCWIAGACLNMLASDVTKGSPARPPLVWNKKPCKALVPVAKSYAGTRQQIHLEV